MLLLNMVVYVDLKLDGSNKLRKVSKSNLMLYAMKRVEEDLGTC